MDLGRLEQGNAPCTPEGTPPYGRIRSRSIHKVLASSKRRSHVRSSRRSRRRRDDSDGWSRESSRSRGKSRVHSSSKSHRRKRKVKRYNPRSRSLTCSSTSLSRDRYENINKHTSNRGYSSDSDSSVPHNSRRYAKRRRGLSNAVETKVAPQSTSEATLLEKIINVLSDRNSGSSGTAIQGAQNVIPDFDPQSKSQTMEDWLSKINESAHVYGWSERQTIFYALPKLKGLAKRWFDGLTSVKYSWAEWQLKLASAFPCEQNYAELLFEMLIRKTRRNESLEEYYYDKVMLINRCRLKGKQAVDCLTHGIYDQNIKMNVQGANLQEPEDVLKYFRNISSKSNESFRKSYPTGRNTTEQMVSNFKRSTQINSKTPFMMVCYNCGETGHPVSKCSKEIIKCRKCRRYGHREKNCTGLDIQTGTNDRPTIANSQNATATQNIFSINNNTGGNDKYFKQITVNGQSMSSFIDMGSQCTLLRKDYAALLNLTIDKTDLPTLKGFASGTLIPLGKVKIKVALDGLYKDVEAYLVEPNLLPADVLIGQSVTEQPNVRAYKTDTHLIFYEQVSREKEKIPVTVSNDMTLSGVNTIEVHTNTDVNGSVFLTSDVCLESGKEYIIVPGVYSFKDGKGFMIVMNLASQPFKLPQGKLLARAIRVSKEHLPDAPPAETLTLKVNSIAVENCPSIGMEQLNVDVDLQPDLKEQLCGLLNSRRNCFAFKLGELGKTSLAEMHIKLKDDEPITYRPYRLSISERSKVNTIIGDMIANGIIRESQSEYASPIILVAKKNGDTRLCVDYRALNRKTIKDKFPMPLIDDQIDSLSGQVYFTSLDLTSGYHQVPVSEESKPLTAFVTPDGHYEYNRMPFGLTNAPAVFQRLILKMLKRRSIPGVLAYMDDIIIASQSVEEGMEKLQAVLDLLEEANLTLNLAKCNFFKKSIEYLGFEISQDGVRPGMRKIEAVSNFKTPRNVHEVRQFVGLSSFFRRFVPSFATVAKPLTSLTKANVKWTWGDEQIKAFDDLKRILTTRPVLAIYNPSYETELHTDASSAGLGGVLLQRPSSETAFQPVAYFSRQTSVEEQHFHSYELETLAVVTSLHRFRVYLLGIDFKVVTDCNALRTTLTKRDLIPRIARWWLLVQEFSFSIEYRPGAKLAHADALSRNSIPASNSKDNLGIDLNILQVDEVPWLQSVQLSDPRLTHIKAVLDNKGQESKDIHNNYVLKDGKIYRKVDGQLKWAVPREARWKICQQCHDDTGHFSYVKTLEKIKRDYWFPKLARFVRKYVRACIPCAHAKQPGGKKQGFLHPIPKPSIPFQCLHIDHLGPFIKSKRGNVYILGIIDSFTKFVVLKAVKNTKSKTSIAALRDVFGLFGTPQNLVSDRGTSFTSNEFKAFMESIGTKHTLNAVATPRANGQIERYNQSILGSLIALCHGHNDKNWDVHINKVQWSLNNTVNQSTGKSPTEIIFGNNSVNETEGLLHEINLREEVSPDNLQKIRAEASTSIEKQQNKMKARYDQKRCKAKVYKVGDLVMAQKSAKTTGESQKLVPAYSGPFRVSAVLDHDRYEISSIEGFSKNNYRNIFPVDKIKSWTRFDESESESDYDGSDEN